METTYVEKKVPLNSNHYFCGNSVDGDNFTYYLKIIVKENNKNFIERSLFSWDGKMWNKWWDNGLPTQRSIKDLVYLLQYEDSFTCGDGCQIRRLSPLEVLVLFGKEEEK